MTQSQLFGQGQSQEPGETPKPSTRELSKYISYYLKNIRAHHHSETKGVIRQIQRLLDGGITLLQLQTALKNYAADPYRQQSDPRLVKHIRSFFVRENILNWQKPLVRKTMTKFGRPVGPRDSSLDTLSRLDTLEPTPAQPAEEIDFPRDPDFLHEEIGL